MSEKPSAKELSPIDVYMLLPKTNCKKCGLENCMAYATKLVNREIALELCTPLLEKQNEKAYQNFLKSKELAVYKQTLNNTFPGGLNYRWDSTYKLLFRFSR